MRHKSTAKNLLCQAQPETPEQKETRLLKKRLEQARKDSALYYKWYEESRKVHDETKIKLNAAWAIVEGNKSTISIYKSMHSIANTHSEMYERWYKQYQQEARDWKEKYEKLLASTPQKFIPPGENIGETLQRADSKFIDLISRIDDALAQSANIPAPRLKSEPTIPLQGTHRVKGGKTVRLICINVGVIELIDEHGDLKRHEAEGLEELDRYTSPGLTTGDNGRPGYCINELQGRFCYQERFHVCQDQPKVKKTRNKKD
jgi:hypothetical protein